MKLSLLNVSKSFGKKLVLSNISYDFPDTGIVAITGPSGCGKTTLLRIICGLEKKFTGEIQKPGGLKTSVAFQEHRLFPNLTALENITTILYDKASDNELSCARVMLRNLSFTDSDMLLYPSELSGGMKQRVSLARAFLRSADVLILDEPTKELDAELIRTVLDIIKQKSQSALVIIVSHRADDIEYLNAEVLNLQEKNALT